MTSVVSAGIEWEAHGGMRFPSEITWDSSCPMMVKIVFTWAESEIEWVFGRDLLIGPLLTSEATGDGDVRVTVLGDELSLYLTSPFGEVRLTAARKSVHDFITTTLNFVPQDRETEHLPLDNDTLAQIVLSWSENRGYL